MNSFRLAPHSNNILESISKSPKLAPNLRQLSTDDVTALGCIGYRRKTIPHHHNPAPERDTAVAAVQAARIPPGNIDLFKLTPIPPVRKYRKPAWGNE